MDSRLDPTTFDWETDTIEMPAPSPTDGVGSDVYLSEEEMPEDVRQRTEGVRIAEDALSKMTWNIAGWDTGIEMDSDVAAFLVSGAHYAKDTYNGIKQLAGVDIEEMKSNQALINDLIEARPVAGISGAVVGAVADPITLGAGAGILAVKGVKGAIAASPVISSAIAGAGVMSVAYVDEESGQTRGTNVAMGAVVGGGVATAVKGVLKGAEKVAEWRTPKYVSTDPTESAVKEFEELVVKARDADDSLTWADANNAVAIKNPELMKRVAKEINEDGIVPNPAEAARDMHIRKAEESGLYSLDTAPTWRDKLPKFSTFDRYIGVVSTRIKALSPKMYGRVQNFEANLKLRIEDARIAREEWAQYFSPRPTSGRVLSDKTVQQFTEDEANELNFLLLNSKLDEAKAFIKEKRGDAALSAFNRARKVMDDLGAEMKDLGIVKDLLSNYHPRRVHRQRMIEFLEAVRGKETTEDNLVDAWEKHLRWLNKQSRVKRGFDLNAQEEAGAFAKFFSRDPMDIHVIGIAKPRKFKAVKEEWVKFYEDPIEAMDSYIHRAVREIETAKLLGKDAYAAGLKNAKETDGLFNLNKAINTWSLAKEMKGMDKEAQAELVELLKHRLGTSMQSSGMLVTRYKQLVHGTLLANFWSAATQLGDLGVSMYKNGFLNTLRAMPKAVAQNTELSVKKSGLDMERYAEWEDIEGDSVRVWVDKLFRWSGFKFVDNLGKTTFMDSSIHKAAEVLKNKDSKRYRDWVAYRKNYFGDEDTNNIIKDLEYWSTNGYKNEDITYNMRRYAFTELARVQPITPSELAQMATMGDGTKMFYTLKSFLIKQLDVLRTDIWHNMANNNWGEAAKNAAKYYAFIGSTNMAADKIKDIMYGREDLNSLDDSVKDSLTLEFLFSDLGGRVLKTFNLDEYTLRKFTYGGVSGAVGDLIIPPAPLIDETLAALYHLEPERMDQIVKYFPIIGRLLNEKLVKDPEPDVVMKFASGGFVDKGDMGDMGDSAEPAPAVTIEKDGKWYNVPTINNGMTYANPDDAIKAFDLGENPALGEYGSLEEAEQAAVQQGQMADAVSEEGKQGMTHTPPEPMGEKGSGVIEGVENWWENATPLDKAALATSTVPIAGDALGLAADMEMYSSNPESRTMGNYALTALGVLPFIPNAAGVIRVIKGGEEVVVETAQKNALDKSPFDGERVTLYRGVEDSTIDKAIKEPRELGSHTTTQEVDIANEFAKGADVEAGRFTRQNLKAGRGAVYSINKQLNKGIVVENVNLFSPENVVDELKKHPAFKGSRDQKMLDDIKKTYLGEKNYHMLRLDTGDIDGNSYVKIKDDLAAKHGKKLQEALKSKGYDHVVYVNKGEALPKKGRGQEAQYDASLILLDDTPEEWKRRSLAVGRKGKAGRVFDSMEEWDTIKGSEWFDKDNIELPDIEDIIRGRREDGAYTIVEMSPEDYLDETTSGFFRDADMPREMSENTWRENTDTKLIDKYVGMFKKGDKAPPIMLMKWTASDGSVHFAQEGRHRAAALNKLGVKTIPVIMVRTSYDPKKFDMPAYKEGGLVEKETDGDKGLSKMSPGVYEDEAGELWRVSEDGKVIAYSEEAA